MKIEYSIGLKKCPPQQKTKVLSQRRQRRRNETTFIINVDITHLPYSNLSQSFSVFILSKRPTIDILFIRTFILIFPPFSFLFSLLFPPSPLTHASTFCTKEVQAEKKVEFDCFSCIQHKSQKRAGRGRLGGWINELNGINTPLFLHLSYGVQTPIQNTPIIKGQG